MSGANNLSVSPSSVFKLNLIIMCMLCIAEIIFVLQIFVIFGVNKICPTKNCQVYSMCATGMNITVTVVYLLVYCPVDLV